MALLRDATAAGDPAVFLQRLEDHSPGRMGALQCRLRSGVAFKVGTGFSDHEREHPPAVGTVISFRYGELTDANVPRFPAYLRVRPDVDASEF